MEENKDLVLEMLVSEDDETGVDIISFVDSPAIEVDFMYFKETQKKFQFKDEEKHLVTGAAMIPNQKIIREDSEGNQFFVFFSEDTIRLCNEMYFKQSKNIGANLDHETPVDNVTVIESWIIEDETNDKAVALGFEGLPKGTWMVTYKVDNPEVWAKIKSGEVLGFSVEGMFGQKKAEFNSEDWLKKLIASDDSDDEKVAKLRAKWNKQK